MSWYSPRYSNQIQPSTSNKSNKDIHFYLKKGEKAEITKTNKKQIRKKPAVEKKKPIETKKKINLKNKPIMEKKEKKSMAGTKGKKRKKEPQVNQTNFI